MFGEGNLAEAKPSQPSMLSLPDLCSLSSILPFVRLRRSCPLLTRRCVGYDLNLVHPLETRPTKYPYILWMQPLPPQINESSNLRK